MWNDEVENGLNGAPCDGEDTERPMAPEAPDGTLNGCSCAPMELAAASIIALNVAAVGVVGLAGIDNRAGAATSSPGKRHSHAHTHSKGTKEKAKQKTKRSSVKRLQIITTLKGGGCSLTEFEARGTNCGGG